MSQSGTVDDDKENTMACIEKVGNIFYLGAVNTSGKHPSTCFVGCDLKYCSKEQLMVSTCRLLCDMLYSLQGQHVNSVYSCLSAREPYGLGFVFIPSEANDVIVLSSNSYSQLFMDLTSHSSCSSVIFVTWNIEA